MTQGMSTSKREVDARKERFCRAYAETGDATVAALAAGYAASNAAQQGCKFLNDTNTGTRARKLRDERLQRDADDFARQQQMLRNAAPDAIEALKRIAVGQMPEGAAKVGAYACVQASIAILDRAGHKPVERVEQTIEWQDVARDVEDVDARAMLTDALEAISASGPAQPDP